MLNFLQEGELITETFFQADDFADTDHWPYVVLDVPEIIAEKVIAILMHYKDEFRASLPVEITIAGSSGNGVIESGHDASEVLSILDSIAKSKNLSKLHLERYAFP
jgi:hypothetical protein